MATVLIYTSPAVGHLHPVMDTALELDARGHNVHIQTLASAVDIVRQVGLRACPVSTAIEQRRIDDWSVRSPLASVKRSLNTFIDRAALEVDDLTSSMRQVQPDLLLIDTNAWGAQAVADASGLPWATWHPYPFPLPSPDVPPFGPGFAPATGLVGKLRDSAVRRVVTQPMQAIIPSLDHIRTRAGAPRLERFEVLYHRPPLVLLMTAEPFEYPRSNWPSNVQRVGPGLWSPTATVPLWLRGALQGDGPIVLVTCSTEYQHDGALIDAAISAFGGDPSTRLVCSTAGVDPATIKAPASVVLQRFVPHALVLPHAASVICHGGMGITQRALAAGVAPCVVPWGRDQLEVARRVVVSEAGTMVPRRRLSGDALRDAVSRARSCGAGVGRVQAGFASAGGAQRAANLLEDLPRITALSRAEALITRPPTHTNPTLARRAGQDPADLLRRSASAGQVGNSAWRGQVRQSVTNNASK